MEIDDDQRKTANLNAFIRETHVTFMLEVRWSTDIHCWLFLFFISCYSPGYTFETMKREENQRKRKQMQNSPYKLAIFLDGCFFFAPSFLSSIGAEGNGLTLGDWLAERGGFGNSFFVANTFSPLPGFVIVRCGV